VTTRHRLAAALLAAVVSILGTSCGGTEDPRPDLVFVSTRDGDYAIFEMNADGEAQRRLTAADTDSSAPRGLFFQVEPAWSQDGERIAFSSRRGGTFDVYAMNADGSGTRRLTATKENDSHPTWSPSGQTIAYAREGDIYVMSSDGSGARRISDPTAEESEPSWSDGGWIAYVRRTPGTLVRELWLMRPNGAARHRITRFGRAIYGPAWSSDGKRIAFSADLDGSVFQIYSVGVDGKGLQRHTQSAEDAFEPSWSPDGTTIAFSRGGSIVMVDPAGSVQEITDPDDNDSSPVWNPKPPSEEES
jgi:Tol biopolymer transport system component